MERPVGIDFGTTFSSIFCYDTGRPTPLVGSHMSVFKQTLININEDGEWSYGNEADGMPGTIFDVKRMLGVPFDSEELYEAKILWRNKGVLIRKNDLTKEGFIEIQIHKINGDLEWISPEEIAGRYLEWLYNDCISQERDNRQIVVTIPANYTQAQRNATFEACKVARFNISNVTLIHESSAAGLALYHLKSMKNKSFENLLVVDFGGTRLNVALMKMNPNSTPCIEVKGIEGDITLGGRDFDKKLQDWVLEQLPNNCKIEEDDAMRINMKCIEVKESFSSKKDILILCKKGERIGGIKLVKEIKISRSEFNFLCNPLLDGFFQPIDRLLNEENISYNEVDGVWLVGGSSNLTLVQEIIADRFPIHKIIPNSQKSTAIAEGACHYALGKSIGKNLKLQEKLMHSIGIEISNPQDSTNPMFHPIFDRKVDHTLSEKEMIFTTVYDNQNKISINIYECDTFYVKDGKLLDNFSFEVQPGPKGEKITVFFKFNESGFFLALVGN